MLVTGAALAAPVFLAWFVPYGKANHPVPSLVASWPLWVVAALVALAWLSSKTPWPEFSRHNMEAFGLVALLAAAGMAAAFTARGQQQTILRIWLVIGGIEAGIVLFQTVGLDPFFLITDPHEGVWRIYGTLGNPNLVSAMLVPLALLSQDRQLIRSGKMRLGFLLVMATAIIATGSRMAALILALGLLWVYFQTKAKSDSRKSGLLIFGAVAGIIAATMIVGHGMGKDFSSPMGRLFFSNVAVHLIADKPWAGHGLGHFEAAYPHGIGLLGSKGEVPLALPVHPDNDWLEFGVELGVIALLLPLLAGWIAWQAWKLEERRITVIAFTSLGLLACWYSPLHTAPTALLFWMLFGILAVQTRQFRSTPMPLLALVLIAGLVSAFGIKPMMNRMHAHWIAGDAEAAELLGDKQRAAKLWSRSLELAPSEGVFAYHSAYYRAKHGQYAEALRLFDQASETYTNFDLYLYKAAVLSDMGQKQQAVALLHGVQATFPGLKMPGLMLKKLEE